MGTLSVWTLLEHYELFISNGSVENFTLHHLGELT